MYIDEFRDFCLSLKGVEESFPFGPDTLVCKVMGKLFALTGLDDETFRVNLKCDPEQAIRYREKYTQIIPGYHMNKKHWNSVFFNQGLGDSFEQELIRHSYDLVIAKLPKKDQEILTQL